MPVRQTHCAHSLLMSYYPNLMQSAKKYSDLKFKQLFCVPLWLVSNVTMIGLRNHFYNPTTHWKRVSFNKACVNLLRGQTADIPKIVRGIVVSVTSIGAKIWTKDKRWKSNYRSKKIRTYHNHCRYRNTVFSTSKTLIIHTFNYAARNNSVFYRLASPV